jgi:hypothetical protein
MAFCAAIGLLTACSSTPPALPNPYAGGAQYPWQDTPLTTAAPLTTGFVSDQQWASASNGWGPIELNKSNGEQAANDGRTLAINGNTYAKGLGVHASSRVKYDLGGGCTTFSAEVGLDDEIRYQNQYGSVVFQVWTDGTKIFDSGKVTLQSPAQTVNVNLSGKQEMQLVVTDAGDNNWYDHANWANARVTCGGTTTPPPPPAGDRFLSDMNPISATNGWGPIEEDFSNGEQLPGDGKALSIRSQTFERGLGVHANSEIRYALNGQCSRFRAVVGIDDEVAPNGSVMFEVWTDNTKLYDSGTVKATSAAIGVDVQLGAAQELRLVVNGAGNGIDYDHADWADARITCGTVTPPPSPPPPPPPPPPTCTSGPCQTGQWSGILPWPVLAIHMNLDATGKIKTWGWRNSDNKGAAVLADTWDPTANTHTTTTEVGNDIFGAGHDNITDGRLFVAGGSDPAKPEWYGITDSWLYNPFSTTWSAGPKMQQGGRWYPTVTTLGNGEVLVASGFNNGGSNIDEVWNPTTNTWRSLTSAARGLPLYPFMHVAPDGRVFHSGPSTNMAWLNTGGTGAWSATIKRDTIYRDYGTAVQYAEGKVLVIGGSSPATNTVQIVDMRNGQVTATSPMNAGRRNLNATLLPNGQVLITGGNTSSVNNGPYIKDAEIWNPANGTWVRLAAAAAPRPYHSTALLLPDGRILTSGGWVQTDSRNAEIFSPPYLFNAANEPAVRPVISNAPVSAIYGSSFSLQSPDAASIDRVTMVRLGSTTHALDMGQRFVELAFTKSGTGITVTAPASGNLAPPGYYMVFILNANGVPSVAKIMQLKP